MRLVSDLKTDHTNAELNPVDRAMVEYSVKLTVSPQEVVSDDVQQLRNVGFDDAAIHDICSIVGYFAFVNRIASGLGVELEPHFN